MMELRLRSVLEAECWQRMTLERGQIRRGRRRDAAVRSSREWVLKPEPEQGRVSRAVAFVFLSLLFVRRRISIGVDARGDWRGSSITLYLMR